MAPRHIKAGRYKLPVPEIDSYSRGNQDFRDTWVSQQWGLEDGNDKIADYYRMIYNSKQWDQYMARKTYRIELKADFNEDSRHEALLAVAKQYARDFLGSAMLLQDGRKPACVLFADDTFMGMEEIDILDVSENLHEPNTGS